MIVAVGPLESPEKGTSPLTSKWIDCTVVLSVAFSTTVTSSRYQLVPGDARQALVDDAGDTLKIEVAGGWASLVTVIEVTGPVPAGVAIVPVPEGSAMSVYVAVALPVKVAVPTSAAV